MKTSDIQSILETFINDTNYRSILIDGKWGIGKTYEFKRWFDALPRRTKKHIYYFSIFGVETMDDLNTKIYRKLHPYWSILRVGYKTISQSVDAVVGLWNTSINVSSNLDFVLDSLKPTNISGRPVLIFDDIERFEYKNFSCFLGLLYKLHLQGARIICLASSEKLDNKEKIFNEYKEKLFDAIYLIEEPSTGVFDSIFTDLTDSNQKEIILNICNQNIRMLRKGELLFHKLVENIAKPDVWIVDKFYVITACCYAIRIALDLPAVADGSKSDETSLYYYLEAEFGQNIARNFTYFLEREKFSLTETMMPNLVENVLRVYFYNNFSGLQKTLLKQPETEEALVQREFFFLSDENKRGFVSLFSKELSNPTTNYDKEQLRILGDIIRFYHGGLDSTLIDNFVRKYFNSCDKNQRKGQTKLENWLRILEKETSDKRQKERVNDALDKISKQLSVLWTEYHTEKLIGAIGDKNIVAIGDYLNNFSRFEESLNIDRLEFFLTKNDFCLPNLSADISENEWEFSNQIAELVHLLGLGESFISYAKKAAANSSSYSLKDRFQALIQYRLKQPLELTEK